MASVDIIMPLYNKAKTIGRAVRSIQQQTMSDWRLIVVDDGSTDNGPEIVRGIKDDRITMVHQENKGPGAARNAGIALARSKYIAFLDADDQWYKWYLENSLNAIRNNDVTLVGAMYDEWPKKVDMTQFWAKRNVHPGKYFLQGDENPQTTESLMMFFHVGNSLMLTDVARKYDGFYDKDLCARGEDTIFFTRIVFNEKVMIIGPPAVRHHREDSNLSNVIQPLSPLTTQPEVVLNYCPAEKRDLLRKALACRALRAAHIRVRKGLKSDAVELLNRYPEAKMYKYYYYYRCRFKMALGPCLPCWVRFKCAVGPPTKRFLKNLACKLHLIADDSEDTLP